MQHIPLREKKNKTSKLCNLFFECCRTEESFTSGMNLCVCVVCACIVSLYVPGSNFQADACCGVEFKNISLGSKNHHSGDVVFFLILFL